MRARQAQDAYCSTIFRACTSTVYVAPNLISDIWDSHMLSCPPSTPETEIVVIEKLAQPRTSHVGMREA